VLVEGPHREKSRWNHRLSRNIEAWLPHEAAVRRYPRGAVEIERGADQGEVGKGLWEVAQLLAGTADFLGEQPQVIVGAAGVERDAVLAAIAEHDRIGRDEFLRDDRFGHLAITG
jgi:hypothetical protein